MTADAVQPLGVDPATSLELGHRVRFPLRIERDGQVEWRSACNCHYWWLIDADEAEAAVK